jgi:hypothetical protein
LAIENLWINPAASAALRSPRMQTNFEMEAA